MPSEPRYDRRVLQVLRPAVGGMKAHVLQLARGLPGHGWVSEIACPGDSDMVQDGLQAGLLVHPVPIVGPLRPVRDVQAVLALRDVIRERRPALIHAHGFKAGLIARVAARTLPRVPVVVTIHNHVLYRGLHPFTRWRYVTVERRLARWTARIITVSDALRDELIAEYGIRPSLVTTIHNGLDLTPFLAGRDRVASRRRYGLPLDATVLGLAARFAPQKAMDVLVEASLPVLEQRPDVWMLLAGDGPTLEQVRTLARRSPHRARILFPGFESDVPGLLAALDVYVSSALSEGLPLATIEAMAAGLPVVSTRAGGTPEVVEEGVTGILVAPGKKQPLSDAMLKLARDPRERTALGENGRARALSEFTEDRMFERTAAVYGEVAR